MAVGEDEQADEDLVKALLFEPNGIEAEGYTEPEQNLGKRPDFKLKKDGKIIAYCEMKSTKDPVNHENLIIEQVGDTTIKRWTDRSPLNLSRHIINAVEQLDAVNGNREVPNIVVIVSHVPQRDRDNLHQAIVGVGIGEGKRDWGFGGRRIVEVVKAAGRVDLFIWVDVDGKTAEPLSPNGAKFQKPTADMLGFQIDIPVAKDSET